jgi:hypothetical protein
LLDSELRHSLELDLTVLGVLLHHMDHLTDQAVTNLRGIAEQAEPEDAGLFLLGCSGSFGRFGSKMQLLKYSTSFLTSTMHLLVE